ncbi:MAG: right-handed parallel beta-helix repeat-containing protein [Candidatus Thorarchaeota archaeon]|nr:right-handed parallel beta-helix repeat-containing protein [Candidatus Thorarchaeota archaeon]
MKKIHVILIVLMLFLVPILRLYPIAPEEEIVIRSVSTPAYTEHAKINVTDNSEFASQGFTGNGILGDPYLLEGVNITDSGTLINIQDTTAYVEIRDCYFSGTTPITKAIELNNADHVTVQGCKFSDVGGANVQSSNNFSFIENEINGTSNFGVYLWSCPFGNISDNMIDGRPIGKQIVLMYSDGSSTNGNTLYNTDISYVSSNSSLISTNEIIEGGHISVSESEYVLVQNNVLIESIGYPAISIWSSSYCNVTSNSVLDCRDEEGTFRVWGSANVILADNIVTITEYSIYTNYGFNVEESSDCLLKNNSASSYLTAGFRVHTSNDITMDNNSAHHNTIGFMTFYANNLYLNNCIADDNEFGFELHLSDNIWVDYCRAEDNTKEGIKIIECNDGSILHTFAFRNGYDGFVIGGVSERTWFWDCQSHSNSRNGFSIELASYTEIWYSHASFNGFNGFEIVSSDYGRFETCGAQYNGDNGYLLDDSNHCIINQCSTSQSTDSGFYLWYVFNITLTEPTSENNGDDGIQIRSSSDILVNGGQFADNGRYGIYVRSSDSVLLEDNEVSGSDTDDILLETSTSCTLSDNVLDLKGLYIKGNLLVHWTHSISDDNLVDLQPIKYYLSQNAMTYDLSSYGQVFLVDCTDIEAHSGSFNNRSVGLALAFSSNCLIYDILTNDCSTGVMIFESDTCSVVSSEFYGSSLYPQVGISSMDTPNTNITGCHFEELFQGIVVDECPSSLFQSNTISDVVGGGFDIGYSPDSVITHNLFTSVNQGTISVKYSERTVIDNNILSQNQSGGISLIWSDYAVLEDNNLTGVGIGIQLFNSMGIRIENNTVFCDNVAIQLYNARDTEIHDNVLNAGLLFESDHLLYWAHEIENNTINGLPLGYFEGLNNTVLNAADFGQVILIGCENVTVIGNNQDEVSIPIYLVSCINVNVSDYHVLNAVGGTKILYSQQCHVQNFSVESFVAAGFYVYESDTITFSGCRASFAENYGFHLYNTENCGIYDSQAWNCTISGAYLQYADNTLIDEFFVTYCGTGLYLYTSDDCSVTSSGIFNNNNGVRILGTSTNNMFYLNELAGNIDHNAWDDTEDPVGNHWDDGIDIGNSWSDYYGGANYTIYGIGGGLDNYPSFHPGYTLPIINPDNQTIFEGVTGRSVTWTCTMQYIQSWMVFVNSSYDSSGNWTGDSLTINLDGLPIGHSIYTLALSPYFGGWYYYVVGVTVLEATTPSIVPEDDMAFWEGSPEQSISWDVTDPYPDWYTIYLNGTVDESLPWDGNDITYLLEGFSAGLYNVTLVVSSESGRISTDTVWVSVLALSVPQIDHHPDLEFEEGSEGKSITWTVSDLYPERFEILINGVLNQTGPWDGSNIIFLLDGFTEGVYNITLIVYSESGPSSTDSAIVTVLPSTSTTTTTTTTIPTTTTTTTTTTTSTETTTTTVTTSTTATSPEEPGPMIILVISVSIGAVVILLIIIMLRKR